MSVTVCPTEEKSLSDCAELALMQYSLQAVVDLIGYSVACSCQNCIGFLLAGGTFSDL